MTCAISLNVVFAQENGTNNETPTGVRSFLELPRIAVIPIKDTQNERQYELYISLIQKMLKAIILYFTQLMRSGTLKYYPPRLNT